MAGSIVSRVEFISSSANHSKIICTCSGFGFWRSATENGTPMSVIQPTISLSLRRMNASCSSSFLRVCDFCCPGGRIDIRGLYDMFFSPRSYLTQIEFLSPR